MKKYQKTIKKPVELEGVGLFTGQKVKVRFVPMPADKGITFVRTDLPQKPRIPASVEYATSKLRRTALSKDGTEVETVEHLLSVLLGLEIDNLDIELDGSEVPNIDGSAEPFIQALKRAEIVEQEAPKKEILLRESMSVSEGDATLVAMPDDKEFRISYTLSYDGSPIGTQHLSLLLNDMTYASEISSARTFCLKSEADALLAQGLGKGGNTKNTLVVGPQGEVIENRLRFKDEFVRHKILDLLGDLALLGAPLRAHVIAVKSGHAINLKLAKKIAKSLSVEKQEEQKKETLLDVREMLKILPHRYPMLLIDKVIELDAYKRAVGIKNVTFNEPYFQGHFPGRPIMPGVLQIEAMAQLAGVLLLRRSDNVKKVPVLLSIEEVRLRKTVVPGDQLRIEAETIKIKSRTGEVYTRTTVEGEVASEATMKFMLVEAE